MGTVAALIVLETAALHLLLVPRVPLLAWFLTAMSLLALAWILGDDRALRRDDAVRVDAEHLHFAVGRRLRGSVPREAVRRVLTPTWRDLQQGPRALNATKPAAPNVLLVLVPPHPLRLVGGIEREVERIALRVDEPARLIAALSGQS